MIDERDPGTDEQTDDRPRLNRTCVYVCVYCTRKGAFYRDLIGTENRLDGLLTTPFECTVPRRVCTRCARVRVYVRMYARTSCFICERAGFHRGSRRRRAMNARGEKPD